MIQEDLERWKRQDRIGFIVIFIVALIGALIVHIYQLDDIALPLGIILGTVTTIIMFVIFHYSDKKKSDAKK